MYKIMAAVLVIKVENWNQLNICQQEASGIGDGTSPLMPDLYLLMERS